MFCTFLWEEAALAVFLTVLLYWGLLWSSLSLLLQETNCIRGSWIILNLWSNQVSLIFHHFTGLCFPLYWGAREQIMTRADSAVPSCEKAILGSIVSSISKACKWFDSKEEWRVPMLSRQAVTMSMEILYRASTHTHEHDHRSGAEWADKWEIERHIIIPA